MSAQQNETDQKSDVQLDASNENVLTGIEYDNIVRPSPSGSSLSLSSSISHETLTTENEKLAKQFKILKKVVVEEREKRRQIEENVRKSEIDERRRTSEFDALNFRNVQLLKRVELLQSERGKIEIDYLVNETKRRFRSKDEDSEDNYLKQQIEILRQDLSLKIDENASLHNKIEEQTTAFHTENRELRHRLQGVEDISFRNQSMGSQSQGFDDSLIRNLKLENASYISQIEDMKSRLASQEEKICTLQTHLVTEQQKVATLASASSRQADQSATTSTSFHHATSDNINGELLTETLFNRPNEQSSRRDLVSTSDLDWFMSSSSTSLHKLRLTERSEEVVVGDPTSDRRHLPFSGEGEMNDNKLHLKFTDPINELVASLSDFFTYLQHRMALTSLLCCGERSRKSYSIQDRIWSRLSDNLMLNVTKLRPIEVNFQRITTDSEWRINLQDFVDALNVYNEYVMCLECDLVSCFQDEFSIMKDAASSFSEPRHSSSNRTVVHFRNVNRTWTRVTSHISKLASSSSIDDNKDSIIDNIYLGLCQMAIDFTELHSSVESKFSTESSYFSSLKSSLCGRSSGSRRNKSSFDIELSNDKIKKLYHCNRSISFALANVSITIETLYKLVKDNLCEIKDAFKTVSNDNFDVNEKNDEEMSIENECKDDIETKRDHNDKDIQKLELENVALQKQIDDLLNEKRGESTSEQNKLILVESKYRAFEVCNEMLSHNLSVTMAEKLKVEDRLSDVRDELKVTRESYEHQMCVMSDHVVKLNQQLATYKLHMDPILQLNEHHEEVETSATNSILSSVNLI